MRVRLTREEMLAKWRTLRAVEPPRGDCTVDRSDGPDLEAIMEAEMRAWYLDRLDHAPASRLAAHQMAAEAQVEVSADGRLAVVTPPEGTRRVLTVGFGHRAPAAPAATAEAVRRAAANPMWGRPTAALLPDGRVAVAAPGGALTDLTVILDPGSETYEFDDSIWKDVMC